MRTELAAPMMASLLTVLACGGSSVTTGPSCGPGTLLVNGQCVAAGGGGGAGGGAGSGGVMNAGGAAGDFALGGSGGNLGGGAGAVAVGAGSPALVDFCAGRDVVATGSPGLLDDFEDGNIKIPDNDGRSALWSFVSNGCIVTPVPLLPEAPLPGATINNASHYALHVTATACPNPSNLSTAFNGFGDGVHGGACGYDASQYDGMYFWAMGANARVDVQVGLRTTISEMFGGDGSCANAMGKGCYDRHGVSLALTGDWKQYSFTWDQLHQAGWGTKADWNVKITTEIGFVATSNIAGAPTVEFSIDNIGFFKGTPPTDPPAGQ